MATYSYRCPALEQIADRIWEDGHVFDLTFKIGTQPETVICGRHGRDAHRAFDAEIATQYVKNDDPFRKAWLGDAEQRAADQNRCLDPEAPHDKFEAKERRERLGRIYIGDDTSQLNEKAVRAIERGKGLGDR